MWLTTVGNTIGQLDVTSNCVHFSFQVLPGYVSSVEDHGYLISFGIEDTRAFLPKKNVTQGITTKLPNALIINCCIVSKGFLIHKQVKVNDKNDQ